MPAPPSIILLNDALKKTLLSMEESQKRRLREKLEFLEQGIWDSGVKVKKLRGLSGKVIFEARVSRGDRILFTLGRHEGRAAVYLWAFTTHDDLDAAARRIQPANAPFLDFTPQSEEELPEVEIERLDSSYFSQEDLSTQVPDDCGPQKWLVLDEGEWRRLLLSPDADRFEIFLCLTQEQEQVLLQDPPLLLSGTAGSGKTTISVYYLLHARYARSRRIYLTFGPALADLARRMVSGLTDQREPIAGEQPPLILTFRELLFRIVQERSQEFPPEREVQLAEFTRILATHPDARGYDSELVWEEIRSIVKGAKLPLNPGRFSRLVDGFLSRDLVPRERIELREYLAGLESLEVGAQVERFIQKRTGLGTYAGLLTRMQAAGAYADGAVAETLQEAVRLVTRRASDFSSPLLSLEEYLALGRKRAPTFVADRRRIYGLALHYQERLGSGRLWDEIDLCRAALQSLEESGHQGAYDLVVCDEVQDFTDVQVSLLFRLARDPRSVVLTGDPRQIINPSGFRWEEVKNKFYERGLPVPDLSRLSLNFRCAGPLVRLANALLEMKQAFVGTADTDAREQWKFGGRPPLLVSRASEEEILGELKTGSAGRIVLTRTEPERDRLKRALSTELVFTIQDAKGLEFDTVLLWKFASEAASLPIWRGMQAGRPDPAQVPRIRHEISLLYVAVTRARNSLILYDGKAPSDVWTSPHLVEHLFRTEDTDRLAELWRVLSTPQEWERQGDYFFERHYYPAARECFRNAGTVAKAEAAEGFLLARAGEHALAAPLLARNGHARQAAESYEAAGMPQQAAELWDQVGETRRARLCRIRALEAAGQWSQAAAAWEQEGQRDRAFPCWEKAGNHQWVGEYLLSAGKIEPALKALERSGDVARQAECWRKLGKLERAADLYARTGDVARAISLYREVGATEKLLRCLQRIGDYRGVAVEYERSGDWARAVDAYRRLAESSAPGRKALEDEISEQPRQRKTMIRSALRLSALGREREAGPLYRAAGLFEPAVRAFQAVQDYEQLAECLSLLGRHREAAAAAEKSDLPDARREDLVFRHLERHLQADPRRESRTALELEEEADRLLAEGKLVQALVRYRALGNGPGALEAYVRLGRDEEAILEFLAGGSPALARKYVEAKEINVSAEFLRTVAMRPDPEEGTRQAAAPAERSPSERRQMLKALFRKALRRLPQAEAEDLLDECSEAVFGFPILHEASGADWDWLLSMKQYNTIVQMVAYIPATRRGPSEAVRPFVSRLETEAMRTGDPALLTCHALATDPDRVAEAASGVSLGARTVEVLGRCRTRYREAVELQLGRNNIDAAIDYCRLAEDYGLAGSLHERMGEMREAINSFLLAKDYAAAMRCARASGKEPLVARVYERQGDLKAAVAVWRRLGRPREVERVLRRLEKSGGRNKEP
ncbi:MAG TPA: UvrD-helicase domain-containing protein [Spirochaetia bacterium]|nr:UvrD-helicase domain-containing protein [Spirochaetia bacterium]